MDNKTIFVRTSKGEDEMHGKTSHLPGGLKRALPMVDGNATIDEIRKRAAPSLRSSLEEMLEELEKGGFIRTKDQGKSKDKGRQDHVPKMSIPVKMATPQKKHAAESGGEELDFMSGYGGGPKPTEEAVAAAEVEAAEAAAEAAAAEAAEATAAANAERLKQEADEKSRKEVEAAKLQALREAESILKKAELEAAKLREEAVRRAKEEAEATKIKVELEARKVREELEAARQKAEDEARQRLEEAARVKEQAEAELLKTEQENKLRMEVAARVRQEVEAERIKADQEADRMRIELEVARVRAELEAKAREEANAKAQARIRAEEEAQAREEAERKIRQEQEIERRIKQEQEEIERKIRQEQEEVERKIRQEQEIERKIRQEQEEVERKIRQEQEIERRIKQEQEIERKIRQEQEIERKIREEQEAAASKQSSRKDEEEPAEEPAEESAEEPVDFSFDSFQVDNPLYTSESHHSEKQSGQNAKSPEQRPKPAAPPPGNKKGGFSFDSFQVDQPLYTSESHHKEKQTEQKAKPATPPKKPGGLFDSFKRGGSRAAESPKINQPVQQPAAPARPAQSAEGRQPARQQHAPSSAAKPADGKPSQEQIRRAEQERKAVEEKLAAEALAAKKMAEEQARVWADAEKRALQTAKAEKEQLAKLVTFTTDETPVARPAPVARVASRRKPVSMGKVFGIVFKLAAVLLVLLVGALFIIPYVFPLRDYMPKAEQMLSAKLHQPVHIGRLSGRILPMPQLEVGEIYIGDAKQFQADDAKINFALSGIFTDEKPVDSIEFEGVKVRGAWVRNVGDWLQKMANDKQYPVERMVIKQGLLDADVFELTGIEGDLDFNENGKFTKTSLAANGGKYALGINVTPENRLHFNLKIHDSALPLLPHWSFDELKVNGELNSNGLIGDYEGRILGGTLNGNANIDWHSGWRAQGTLNAKSVPMKNVSKLMEGNVEGSARFKMTSLDLGGLPDTVTLDGNFTSHDGLLGGLEIVETARKRSKENIPGGRTHYDDLSGVVSYANGVYHFKQTKINSTVLTATAAFDVDSASQQLTGKMNVNMSLHEATAPVDLVIGGTYDSPTLHYEP